MLESGTFEFYFLKDESEKIIGYTILSFPENKCIIEQFAVLEEGKGLGTLLFQKTLEIVKFKKLKKITLWCPFLGAQEFWKKMGFKRIIGSGKANENLLKQAGASSLASIDNGFELSIKQ
jgi:N-acetylglutamate synthase-like GNAT family acetyltransferase